MASRDIFKGSLVIFFMFFVKNVISRYGLDKNIQTRVPTVSQLPIYIDLYQQCRYQICSNSTDYPGEQILQIMKNTPNLEGLFGIVLNSTYDPTQLENRNNFPKAKIKNLCNADTTATIQPRVMRNINLDWKYVVNVDGYYQRFTAELCRNGDPSNRKTRSNDSCSKYGYECRQSYQEMFLLTYENNVIDFDKFMIPTTCNCVCDFS